MNRHPEKFKSIALVIAVAAAIDASVAAFRAPFPGKVTKLVYVPNAAIVGANANTRTLSLKNRGQAGAGATVVASLALTAGVNAAAFDEKAITLSVTAADLVVAEGDILSAESIHTGTGLADPGGLYYIEIERTDPA